MVKPGVIAFAIAAIVFLTLFSPAGVQVLFWVILAPLILIVWGLARNWVEHSPPVQASMKARRSVAAIIIAVAVASVAYRLIFLGGLQQTAALFIGIPAILAVIVVLAVTPRTAKGVACKAVTVGLLVSMIFLEEGVLCILMSAPIFYAVALVIAAVVDYGRKKRRPVTLASVVLIVLIPVSLEGVIPWLTASRDETVSAMKVVHASAQEVQRALFDDPRFDRPLPLYLRAGFPRPIATAIENTGSTMRWVIRFRGGETRLNGTEPVTGDLILRIEEARPGYVRWRAVSDSSHMTHFLRWKDIVVQWEPVTPETTKVVWLVHYERGLEPSWYFGPWERYAMRLASEYLIDAVATP